MIGHALHVCLVSELSRHETEQDQTPRPGCLKKGLWVFIKVCCRLGFAYESVFLVFRFGGTHNTKNTLQHTNISVSESATSQILQPLLRKYGQRKNKTTFVIPLSSFVYRLINACKYLLLLHVAAATRIRWGWTNAVDVVDASPYRLCRRVRWWWLHRCGGGWIRYGGRTLDP